MKKVQINFRLKKTLLKKVDEKAERLGLDRMEFIRNTLSKEVMIKQED